MTARKGKAVVSLAPVRRDVRGDKRQHIPYLLNWVCPCGKRRTLDLSQGDHYVGDAAFGKKTNEVYLWCPDCGYEEQPKLKLTIRAELI